MKAVAYSLGQNVSDYIKTFEDFRDKFNFENDKEQEKKDKITKSHKDFKRETKRRKANK